MVKKDDMVQLIAAWLSTIKEFGTFSDPFRLSLVNSFTLAHASDKYRKFEISGKKFLNSQNSQKYQKNKKI